MVRFERLFLPLVVALLPVFAPAQAPPPAPKPCALVVPNIVSPNAERNGPSTCACAVKAFSAEVFTRWGNSVWRTTELARFPQDVLGLKDVAEGTYFWKATYTVTYADGRSEPLEQTGTFTLLK